MPWKSKMDEKLAHLIKYLTPGGTDIPTTVQNMADEEAIKPNIPIGVFLQEAYSMFWFAQDDREKLFGAKLDPALYYELPRRIQHLRRCEAVWWKARYGLTPIEAEYRRVKELGLKTRTELLRHFSHLARHDMDFDKIVENIEQGEGDLEDMFDLRSLNKLCNQYKDKLLEIRVEPQLLEDVAFCTENIFNLYTQRELDDIYEQRKQLTRNKAYTYLLVAVEEVRRCAYHVFWYDKEHLRGYLSEYFRRKPKDT